MKNVMITGGAGFIGSNFIRHTQTHYPDIKIVNLDLLTYAGSQDNLIDLPDPDRHILIEGDICDRELVRRILNDYDVDLLVHFAAESHVDRSILGPDVFIHTNILGTFSLLEEVRASWSDDHGTIRQDVHFHHISTDEVYGSLGPDDPAFSEKSQIAPNSPYAASKAASDHLVRSYYHTYRLPVTITNCSNNYGPYQFPEKLIPLMVLNALENQPLPIYGDGKQIRDWLFVEDHCRAIWAVIDRGTPGETYNVGGDNQPTNLEIVRTICDVLDEIYPGSDRGSHARLIEHVKDRPGHDRRYAMNIDKISGQLGWEPRVDLQEGILDTINWYINHPDWVARIKEQVNYQSWVEKNYQKRYRS